MAKFIKKSVVVDAVRVPFDAEDIKGWNAVIDFLEYSSPKASWNGGNASLKITISTPEGYMTAHAGDWIIRGVKGEFYPCKPHIFWATYEPEGAIK